MRVTLLLVFLFLPVNPAYSGPEAQKECLQILEKRCEKCHYLGRICQGVEKKSKRQWKATLKRMVKQRGAVLEGDEQEELLGCLTQPAPEIIRECKEYKK